MKELDWWPCHICYKKWLRASNNDLGRKGIVLCSKNKNTYRCVGINLVLSFHINLVLSFQTSNQTIPAFLINLFLTVTKIADHKSV